MTAGKREAGHFVPDLVAVYQELADSLRGWAKALGVEAEYCDARLEEGGSNAWGD